MLRPLGAGLLAVGLVALAVTPSTAAPPGRQTVKAGAPSSAPDHMVTLITGDRVQVSADLDQVHEFPGRGRSGVRFTVDRSDGHLYVIPSDALTLLGRRQLDVRLFDVTELVADGYDDAHRSDLPLIVTSNGAPAAAATALRDSGATAQRQLPGKSRAAHVPKSELPQFFDGLRPGSESTSGIAKVWLDGRAKASLDQSVPQIGAPTAWQAGLTGKGVKVAVLDTGIDATHPDLSDAVLEAQDFTGSESGTQDVFGHGTHVASIVTGSGAASDGKYKGVAPDAGLLVGKVLGDDGWGFDSQIIAGMQWAAAEGARVVNMSLGKPDSPGVDPIEDAVDTLTAQTGALFVVAAGNQPDCQGGVESPGSADAALAVGAVDGQDQMADFSCAGPRAGDGAVKPDITAPGVGIVAARAAGAQIGEPVGDAYMRLSGTSMATPHAAGAAAILAQEHPDWRAGQLKAALMASAKPTPGVAETEQGAGRVDVAKAITQTLTSEPSSLSFGLASFPHQDDAPVTRTVTYSNGGTTDVTLTLTAELTAPDGSPAASSSLALSADTITVPAGGTASVSVTSDTRTAGPNGVYTGRILATGGGQSVATPLSVEREVESYDLTISHLDRSGATTGDYVDIILPRDSDNPFGEGGRLFVTEEDGVTNLRLPMGHYLLESTIGTEAGGESSVLVQPRLDLTGDLTSTVDARTAQPITITVPEATARNSFFEMAYTMPVPDVPGSFWYSSIFSSSGTAGLYTAQIGLGVPELNSLVSSQWARPDPAGGEFFDNTPYVYALAWQRSGGYFTGFNRSVHQSELATVKPTIAAHQPGTAGVWSIAARSAGMSAVAGWGYGYAELPASPTVYATTEQVQWSSGVILYNEQADEAAFLDGTPVSYSPGRTYREQWAQGVMGPAFPASGDGPPSASRTGDVLSLDLQEADGAGHYGRALTGNGSLTLYRDGTELGSTVYSPFDLPDDMAVEAGPGDYRLDLETSGNGVSDLSTAVQTSWTFTSTTPAGDGTTVLPLWAIRFHPAVDDHNVLHAGGGTHTLPVVMETQQGSAVGALTGLTVQTSTDDGQTWRDAPARTTGTNAFAAQVTVPEGAAYVSVKAQATDSLGNTVKETITRAYKVSG